ncbi:MAG TPA: c-type cytochrome [Casimicrobiaceae bacterium]|nr:c-type cytochrome [Casimicrobiaceae bacterium]
MKRTLLAISILASFGLAAAAQAAGDAQAGKAKAGACAGCHGANGEGKGSFPALAGKSEPALEQAMHDYKSGKRSNAMMKGFVDKLSDQDIANLAAYYASLKGK